MIRASLVMVGIAVVAAAGCSSEIQPVDVRGTVALNGKPVPHGRIVFNANDGSPPEMIFIKDGTFDGKVKPGKKRVEIIAERKTGRKNHFYPDEDELENYIPWRYNIRSELSEEIPPEGRSGLTFALKGK